MFIAARARAAAGMLTMDFNLKVESAPSTTRASWVMLPMRFLRQVVPSKMAKAMTMKVPRTDTSRNRPPAAV